MPDGAIEANHLWKRFRGDRRRRVLRDELERIVDRMRGRGGRGWKWALQDIDFAIEPGEAVGLFGVNGSGKSTLLKILTRVMYPYAGNVSVGGRVGALIEIKAGIHPDLTGRENIYLYGSLLGLPRKHVADRFDNIVAFAELEDAIDRQVKFYSSGMNMRLGFAVAAYLEPDVLLVDEVLAVGDASFQQKCLDRMREVIADGTTLVFVSHDLAAVEAICSRGIWLAGGEVQFDGPIRESLSGYRRSIEEHSESLTRRDGVVRLVKVEVAGDDDGRIRTEGPFSVRMVMEAAEAGPATLYLGVSEGPGTPIFSLARSTFFASGETEIRCAIETLPLPRGRFFLWVGVFGAKGHDLLQWHPAEHFDVIGPELDPAPRGVVRLAPVHVTADWEIEGR